MTENEIATKVLDAAFRVHTELGPGLLEVVYRTAMVWELMSMGLHVQIEHPGLGSERIS
jgi:GxxExxY protein